MQIKIPKFITHYSRGEPFLSISDVPSEIRPTVIGNLNESNAWGLNRFTDPDYLIRRLETENKLRAEFISRGGMPVLTNPIYFFLGRHKGFEEHPRNIGYVIELNDLSLDSISFTYGDSMLAYNTDYREHSGPKYTNSLCARIFLKTELEGLFSNPDFPQNDSLNIECQLWCKPTNKVVKLLENRV